MPVVSKGEFTVSRLDDGVSSHLHVGWLMADGTFTTEYPGENLIVLSQLVNGTYDQTTGLPTSGSDLKRNTAPVMLESGASYVVSNSKPTKSMRFFFYDADGGYISTYNTSSDVHKITIPSNATKMNYILWSGSSTEGSYVYWKLEKGATPTIYTPAPSEDYTLAYPKYRGEYTDTIEADSTNPDDYTWTAYLGEQGPPTGVISQSTVPSSPYVGMLWQNTGNVSGYISNATYRWNGSAWEIYQFTAQNILAETFTGFVFRGVEFIGSKFVSEFDIPLGAEVGAHAVGQTVIENGEIVTDMVEYWSEGSGDITASYDKHLEYSPANGVYMSYKGRRSNVSQEAQLAPGGLRLKVTGFEGTLTAEVLEQMNNCGKVLWEGAMYLTNNHTVTPSIPISKCLNGWTLVWSRYNPGVGPDDSRFKYTTVPKGHIASFPGKGITEVFIAPASETNNVGVGPATKYFYVTDTTIKGYAANSVSPGNGWCIRMVVAW